ncbi:ferredoxin [Streptomyces sp. NPDC059835]|uniref:ferredoxin n=1 Tax=Streptomyces sp. NPDC059835 TaxID=3346967 RepID=UPI003647E17E
MTYWDPIPTLTGLAPDPAFTTAHGVTGPWAGRWEQRNWLGVPGPFYGADTDTCLTGRLHAPDLVLYDDRYGQEFVYRQPRGPQEVRDLHLAATEEAFLGYNHDGDLHWTPELVRDWWRERGRVREWAVGVGWGAWATSERAEYRDTAAGARAYAAHIDGPLSEYLRGYLFHLTEARPPRAGEALPPL